MKLVLAWIWILDMLRVSFDLDLECRFYFRFEGSFRILWNCNWF